MGVWCLINISFKQPKLIGVLARNCRPQWSNTLLTAPLKGVVEMKLCMLQNNPLWTKIMCLETHDNKPRFTECLLKPHKRRESRIGLISCKAVKLVLQLRFLRESVGIYLNQRGRILEGRQLRLVRQSIATCKPLSLRRLVLEWSRSRLHSMLILLWLIWSAHLQK